MTDVSDKTFNYISYECILYLKCFQKAWWNGFHYLLHHSHTPGCTHNVHNNRCKCKLMLDSSQMLCACLLQCDTDKKVGSNSLHLIWHDRCSFQADRVRWGGGYLLVVLIQPFDLGVVYRQVPTVCCAHLVAVAVEHGLPLGGHRLQWGQHRAPTTLS